jgi:hypothetical protein
LLGSLGQGRGNIPSWSGLPLPNPSLLSCGSASGTGRLRAFRRITLCVSIERSAPQLERGD